MNVWPGFNAEIKNDINCIKFSHSLHITGKQIFLKPFHQYSDRINYTFCEPLWDICYINQPPLINIIVFNILTNFCAPKFLYAKSFVVENQLSKPQPFVPADTQPKFNLRQIYVWNIICISPRRSIFVVWRLYRVFRCCRDIHKTVDIARMSAENHVKIYLC